MVFVLLDNADKAWDTLVSGFILESAAADYHEAGAAPELIDVRTPAETAASGEASASAAAGAGAGAGAGAEMHHLSPTYPRWRLAKLRAYFCWTKANFNPEISAEAGEVLGKLSPEAAGALFTEELGHTRYDEAIATNPNTNITHDTDLHTGKVENRT